MALTNSGAIVDDWTDVTAGVIVHSTVIDISSDYEASLYLQAGMAEASTTHDGTRFIIQTSALSSGDEDWADYTSFVKLAGTSTTASLTTGASANDTNLIDTKDTIAPTGIWCLLENGLGSELVFITVLNAGSVDILDGLTNGHSPGTLIVTVAFSEEIKIIGTEHLRARIIIDNNHDTGGSDIAYKLAKAETTTV